MLAKVVQLMLIYRLGKKEKETKKQQLNAAPQKSKVEGKLFKLLPTLPPPLSVSWLGLDN